MATTAVLWRMVAPKEKAEERSACISPSEGDNLLGGEMERREERRGQCVGGEQMSSGASKPETNLL